MTLTQTPLAGPDTAGPEHLPVEQLVAHADAVTQAVAAELCALVSGTEFELGPAETQDDPSDLAPATGLHGVMVSLSGGPVAQVAVVLDDELHDRLAGFADDPGAPPAWLGAASHAVETCARAAGAIVSGAMPIERPAEIDHLLGNGNGLVLIAAGIFHDGRHAGTVALVARVADADADGTGDSGSRSGSGGNGGGADRSGGGHDLVDPVGVAVPPSARAQPADAPSAVALRALAEVEMMVTAELGRTRMNVSDLLDLGPGSLIELDRTAGSPIDLLVNGTLIARGEVVVIDEEYGIRLTEIVGSGEG